MRILSALVILVAIVTFVIALIAGVQLKSLFEHTPAGWLKLTQTLLFFAIAFLLYQIAGAKAE